MIELEIPDAVDWHEGMLLAPQHFQLMMQRSEALLARQVSALGPYQYGFSSLVLDRARILEGVLQMRSFEGIMPDGLLVSARDGESGLVLNLAEYTEALVRGPLKIYLVVPVRRHGETGRVDGTRYLSVEGAPVVDESTGQGNVNIPRLVPRLTLIAGDLPSNRFVGMPIAEVVLKDEAFSLTDFVAPRLFLKSSEILYEECRGIVTRLREKAAFLIEDHRGEGNYGRQVAAETRTVAAALVGTLPLLETLCLTDRVHPFEVYKCLMMVAGGISAAGVPVVPPTLQPYRHDDPRSSFDAVANFILQRLRGIQVLSREEPFVKEDGVFRLILPEEWVKNDLTIGVRHHADTPVESILNWMRQSLIASKPLLNSISERRILGAARRAVENNEMLGVRSSNLVSMFTVEKSTEFILPDEPLVIANLVERGDDTGPTEIVLFVPNDIADDS
jgi:type VI secretion system protein ImpJ